MLTEVHLYGDLAMRFGSKHQFEVFNPAEAVRALECNYRGFYSHIRGGKFQVVTGDYTLGDDSTGEHLCQELLSMGCGGKPIHIVPVVEGGKSAKGIITVILGVALIAAAIYFAPAAASLGASLSAPAFGVAGFSISFTQIAMFGAALTLGGVSQLLAPSPQVTDYKTRDKKVSFLFDGAVNRSEQGGAVPLVLGGPIRVGSIIASGGVTVYDGKAKLPEELCSTITALPKNGIKPCGQVQVLNASGITFKIRKTTGDGKSLHHVLVDTVNVGKILTYTFNNVVADHTITAVYQ